MSKPALILTGIISLLIGGASLLLPFNKQVSFSPNHENMSNYSISNHISKEFPEHIQSKESFSSERHEDENYTITDDFDFEDIQEYFTPSIPDHEDSIPSFSEPGDGRTEL